MPKSARQKSKPTPTDRPSPPGYARPDASWSLDTLASYAKGAVANSEAAEQLAILQAKKSAVYLFRAGHALVLAREKCKAQKHGDWAEFKRKYGLAGTSANDAIRLYENAKTEEAVEGLGITEAKKKFVYPAKEMWPKKVPSSRKTATDPDQQESDSGPTDGNAGVKQDGNRRGELRGKSEKRIEEPEDQEGGESALAPKEVIVRLFSDGDRETVRTAVADHSPVVKTATGVRLVSFGITPRQLGGALEALFESLVKIESFGLEVR